MSVWTELHKNIGGFLKNALQYGGDLGEAGGRGLAKGLVNAVDLAGDATAFATDFTGLTENAGDKEGWIDRGAKKLNEAFDKSNVIDSDWGKTGAGKFGLDATEKAAEILLPGVGMEVGLVKGAQAAGKGLKYGKEAITALRNEPKAMAELKALMQGGKELAAKDVEDIATKYGIDLTKKVAGKMAGDAGDAKILAEMAGSSTDAADMAKIVKSTDRAADIVKKLSNMDAKELEQVLSKYPKLKALMTGKTAKAVTALALGWAADYAGPTGITISEEAPGHDDLQHMEDQISEPVKTDTKQVEKPANTEDFHGYKLTKNPDGSVSYESNEPGKVGLIKKAASLDEAKKYIYEQNKKAIDSGKDIAKNKDSGSISIDITPEKEKELAAEYANMKKKNPNFSPENEVIDYMKKNGLDVSPKGLAALAKKLGMPKYDMNSDAQDWQLYKLVKKEAENEPLTM